MTPRIKLFFRAALFCLMLVSPPLFSQSRSPDGTAAFQYRQGRQYMAAEDWYSAAEALLECLKFNPAHAEAAASLAECYYELGEYDEALLWVRKGRVLSRGNLGLANLEAVILIAVGRLDEAAAIISGILDREPYNRDALFAAAELDIARGRTGDALIRYRSVEPRYPDDRRLLVSLALVQGSLGDAGGARASIEKALVLHPGDYRVYYYAAYLDAQAGRFPQAIEYAAESLALRPGFTQARSLLASLYYRSGRYEEAARLADEAIAADRNDVGNWYLKGMAYTRMGRRSEAAAILASAAAIDPEDEFVRTALEDLIIYDTPLENSGRARWASWHFGRAREYRSRNLGDQALFEYRRGIRLNPYAPERQEYADLLRIRGFPSRYLEELKFMQSLGLGGRDLADAVETYEALLADALHRRWPVEPVEFAASSRHWKLAVFSVASQSAFYHADAGSVASSFIKDLLVHDRSVEALETELRQPSFSQAFRTAREAGADYFLVISVSESERDLSVKGELFTARTGSSAGTFHAYRTGADRLRNAARSITDQLDASLPFRGVIVRRRASQALADKGRADGVEAEQVYDVVKKGRAVILNEGIGLSYTPEDTVGTFVINQVDEEVSLGTLSRSGFFDRIEAGDEIILQKPKDEQTAAPIPANPELREMLRYLRY
ncbi:MAG: tetratricopeptide repeat protein [Spirochaetaceae bacterium]|jgi:tetratricopeptide (TPR) repeat protein|nr:tetratricopeptide repeat protein [Spirochaetaceae bacterium]